MALASIRSWRGVVVGGRHKRAVRRDDAAPAPGLGLAGPAPFERRQELAVQVVRGAVRGVRVNIRVGDVNPVMRLLWTSGTKSVAERGDAARGKAPLAFRGREAGGERPHSATFRFAIKGLSAATQPFKSRFFFAWARRLSISLPERTHGLQGAAGV